MADDLMGIIPPMTTPFNGDGSIDTGAFRAEVRYLVETGVHGLAVGGSTGEGHTLTDDETAALAEIATSEADGNVPIVAGIIVNSTRQAVPSRIRVDASPPFCVYVLDSEGVEGHGPVHLPSCFSLRDLNLRTHSPVSLSACCAAQRGPDCRPD